LGWGPWWCQARLILGGANFIVFKNDIALHCIALSTGYGVLRTLLGWLLAQIYRVLVWSTTLDGLEHAWEVGGSHLLLS
jgi:hypothetical protein